MLKIELSLQEIQIIVQAIHEVPMPYKLSAPLLQKLESQVQPQLKEDDGDKTD